MSSNEVEKPILNSPYEEPESYWFISEQEPAEIREGRRSSIVFPNEMQKGKWEIDKKILKNSEEYPAAYELVLVNQIRHEVRKWRLDGYPGITRTSSILLDYWNDPERDHPLFFTQKESAETAIFLLEACAKRPDLKSGIKIPREEGFEEKDYFSRYAFKMATGTGKTTVMAMLAAWSILNRVQDKKSKIHSDAILIVSPNLTIKNRLQELDPRNGDASVYRTRDLVPPDLMADLQRGRVVITNWHVFEAQSVQKDGAKVNRAGVEKAIKERIRITDKGSKKTRGVRDMTRYEFDLEVNARRYFNVEEVSGSSNEKFYDVESLQFVESDRAVVERVLGRDFLGRKDILVFNDEAHHAYRIPQNNGASDDTEETDADQEESPWDDKREATVWMQGLDRVHSILGIRHCMDFSATPYAIGRSGKESGKPFPWIVSDFGLMDAIESGLVKIPQLAIRDTTGKTQPGYFRLWDWTLEQMSPAEKGGGRSPKPEAVLKYAHSAIAMLAGEWEKTRKEWKKTSNESEVNSITPVFIIIAKNTKISQVLYEWIAEENCPENIPPLKIDSLRNLDGKLNTIRVDSKVIAETETEGSSDHENRWMRFTLDTVGKKEWPLHPVTGLPLYPEGFLEIAEKLNRPLHPPGRDIRCIISVGMLTEGWDCNTVTHIIGLRPFQSQLLCEQVVGRGLRRASYQINEKDEENAGLFSEETATVFGVPFEVIPFKTASAGLPKPTKQNRIFAVPKKSLFEITFPRVDHYMRKISFNVSVDWNKIPQLELRPDQIATKVDVKGYMPDAEGNFAFNGPGVIQEITLEDYYSQFTLQQRQFDFAKELTVLILKDNPELLPHIIFPRFLSIVKKFCETKIIVKENSDIRDAFISPYYSKLMSIMTQFIQPEVGSGDDPESAVYEKHRKPGSTKDVNRFTKKNIYPVTKCHLNAIVCDTKSFEQQAAYFLDHNESVQSFVKNDGLGFGIPYIKDQDESGKKYHEYNPDFIVKIKTVQGLLNLILETKGFLDYDKELKAAAANRWVDAVNQEGSSGIWKYAMVYSIEELADVVGKLN